MDVKTMNEENKESKENEQLEQLRKRIEEAERTHRPMTELRELYALYKALPKPKISLGTKHLFTKTILEDTQGQAWLVKTATSGKFEFKWNDTTPQNATNIKVEYDKNGKPVRVLWDSRNSETHGELRTYYVDILIDEEFPTPKPRP